MKKKQNFIQYAGVDKLSLRQFIFLIILLVFFLLRDTVPVLLDGQFFF